MEKGKAATIYLLKVVPQYVSLADENGKTPLQCAAYTGYMGVMQVLLENGANVNEKDNVKTTALSNAVISGLNDEVISVHKNMVRLLLEKKG
jgi:ankyrin repeat protein